MRKPEQRLSDRTGRNLRSEGVYAERIENTVGSGTPDLLTAYKDQILWIEHKVVEWPKKKTTRVQFLHAPTPEQLNWHKIWTQHGRRSIFLISNGDGPASRIFGVDGSLGDDLAAMTQEALEKHELTYGALIHHIQGWSEPALFGKTRKPR